MENLIKPGAQYQWQQEAVFSLTAEQFGMLYNSLANMVNTDTFKTKVTEAQQTLGIVQLQQVMTDVLNGAIGSGIATEVVPTEVVPTEVVPTEVVPTAAPESQG